MEVIDHHPKQENMGLSARKKTPWGWQTVQSLAQTELALLCLADQLSSQSRFFSVGPIIIS
jgi:hypothetical protein